MRNVLKTALVFGVVVPVATVIGYVAGKGRPDAMLIGVGGGIVLALVLSGLAPAEWTDTLFPPADVDE